MTYRILPHPNATRSQLALAPKRERLEDAVADMAEGLVVDGEERVVAFHERHLTLLDRGYGTVAV